MTSTVRHTRPVGRRRPLTLGRATTTRRRQGVRGPQRHGSCEGLSLSYADGGTNEGTHGDQLQTIVTMFQYNQFGQLTKTITPEGNVNTEAYFPENNPNGDGHVTPPPGDGRTLDGTIGGYLKQTVTDATRSYFDQNGNPSTGAFS